MHITPEIIREERAWHQQSFLNTSLLKDITDNILARYGNLAKLREVEFSVLLTNDDHITKLNGDFRGKYQPTNILSFPDIDLNNATIVEFQPNNDYLYLGDIALAYETISAETVANSINFQEHFIHLFIHGILHLLGYDHQQDTEADIMEKLEIEILSQYNIPPPY